jgi:hypothetical protein
MMCVRGLQVSNCVCCNGLSFKRELVPISAFANQHSPPSISYLLPSLKKRKVTMVLSFWSSYASEQCQRALP